MRPPLQVFPDTDAMAPAMAGEIAATLRRAIQRDGAALFAGAGGRTPGGVYRALSAATLDWNRVAVTLTDERFVRPDHADSNEGLFRRTLLQGPASAAAFVPLWSGASSPQAAATAADAALAGLGRAPDVVLLGMGEDGHVASLFPGNPALAEGLRVDGARRCIAVPPSSPAPTQARLSLTLPFLARAGLLLLLITGEAKRAVFEAAAAGNEAAPSPVSEVMRHATNLRAVWAP